MRRLVGPHNDTQNLIGGRAERVIEMVGVSRCMRVWLVVAAVLVAVVWWPGHPARSAVAAAPEASMRADFDGDGFTDLAVGLPGEDLGEIEEAGVVQVLYGGPSGLTARDQVWHQDRPGIEDAAEAGDQFGWSVAAGDFDGDGFGDLAVGVLDESIGGVQLAGMVQVLYGGASGLTARDQVWHQDTPGIEDAVEQDQFGFAVAAADFDGDGFADLAVGVPGESVGTVQNAGAVSVLYGGSSGLTARDQIWHQDTPGIGGAAESDDGFGWALSAGDFDGDGRADLAVGVPFESVGGVDQAGMANVLYGGPSGLTARDQVWHQDRPGIKGTAELLDNFGWALSAGDFDGDGRADLAVGVPRESVGGVDQAGMANVLYGGPSGLTARDQVWHQDRPGIKGTAEFPDNFGRSAVADNFDGDGFADLAVGVPGESVGAVQDAGAVSVLYGGPSGLTARDQVWHQDSPGIKGASEFRDRFGRPLTAGDFDGDSRADLAVGVPEESVGGVSGAGMVSVLYGGSAGLTARDQVWHQDIAGMKGVAEVGDGFGSALAASGG